jgi:hypothetical protein
VIGQQPKNVLLISVATRNFLFIIYYNLLRHSAHEQPMYLVCFLFIDEYFAYKNNQFSILYNLIKSSYFSNISSVSRNYLGSCFSQKITFATTKIRNYLEPTFYLPHMEYEGSFGFATGKMKFFYRGFSRFRTFYT